MSTLPIITLLKASGIDQDELALLEFLLENTKALEDLPPDIVEEVEGILSELEERLRKEGEALKTDLEKIREEYDSKRKKALDEIKGLEEKGIVEIERLKMAAMSAMRQIDTAEATKEEHSRKAKEVDQIKTIMSKIHSKKQRQ
jgi:ElaB/YqjD/DUF883 family membrane-anchored ribosome-binding protein